MKKKVTFCIGRLWVGSFYTVKGAVLFFVKITETWLERDLTHTLHSWKTHSHTHSHTRLRYTIAYIYWMKQSKKKTRVSTRLSLYIQTQISVVVDSIIWGFIVDFIFLQMKIKKETSNAMLMWVTFLLIERGIIAEQTKNT